MVAAVAGRLHRLATTAGLAAGPVSTGLLGLGGIISPCQLAVWGVPNKPCGRTASTTRNSNCEAGVA